MKFAAAWLCRVIYCIYINGWDSSRQPSSWEYGRGQGCRDTHIHRVAHGNGLRRPVDVSWLLYKVPTPRGIYIPRLLSIIRHLPFFFFPPHSFSQTPRSCRRKILISVLTTWQRAIEIGIPRRGESRRVGHESAEDNKGDVFPSVSDVSVPQNFWQCWWSGIRLIWQLNDILHVFFFFGMCVGAEIRPAVRSGECQHHLSLHLVAQPQKRALLSGIPWCAASLLINLRRAKNSWRGGDLVITTARNRRWSRNV